jgi:hypothetical protein
VLAAASSNQSLSSYDVATRTRAAGRSLPRHRASTSKVGSTPTATTLAINDRHGIALWDINPEHLAEAACRLAGRNLTPTEWDTYLADEGDYRPTCPNNPDHGVDE